MTHMYLQHLLSAELQTYIFKCPSDFSPWMFPKHINLVMSKARSVTPH